MLLSLLETILVTYLIENDTKDELNLWDKKEDQHLKTKNHSRGKMHFTLDKSIFWFLFISI